MKSAYRGSSRESAYASMLEFSFRAEWDERMARSVAALESGRLDALSGSRWQVRSEGYISKRSRSR